MTSDERVTKAVAVLEAHSGTLESKVAFLKEKGCTNEEVAKALAKVMQRPTLAEEKNPFDGLSDENAKRLYVHLTMSGKMTMSEIYDKYGYMVPAEKGLGIHDSMRIAADIAQRGVIVNSSNDKPTSKPTGTGCMVPIVVSLIAGITTLCLVLINLTVRTR